MSEAHQSPEAQGTPLHDELAAEFNHHIDMIEREELACGTEPEAARARALHRFGDQTKAARACTRAMQGESVMASALDISKIAGLVAWRLGITTAIVLSMIMSWNAHERAVQASNIAASVALQTGLDLRGAGSLSPESRAAILSSIWGTTAGEVEVAGAVARPGKFATDINHPLDLAALIESAGGATSGASTIVWRQREGPGESYTTLANAIRYRGDFNNMPAPGSLITVK